MPNYPTIETTDLAWEFARSVTGYGYDKPSSVDSHAPAQADDQAPAVAASKRRDPLDYSKWESLAKEIEEENEPQAAGGADDPSRLVRSIQEARENPEEALKTLTGQKEIDEDPNADPQDVSAYFADNPMRKMGGCAHDRSKERAVYERPNSEKLRMAKRFRTEGNQYFAEKDYSQAATFYRKALLYYDYTIPETDQETTEFNQNKIAAHLNLAAAYLNLKQYEECRTQCYQATQIDPKCTKAYYRYGQAYMGLDEYDKALESFEKARLFSDGPTDPGVTKAISNCLRKKEEWKIKSPALYKKMFDGATQQSEEDQQNLPETGAVAGETQVHTLVSDEDEEEAKAERVEISSQKEAQESEDPSAAEKAEGEYAGPQMITLGSSSSDLEGPDGVTKTAEELSGKEREEIKSSSPEPSLVRIFSDQSPVLGATAPPNSQVPTEGDSCNATAGSSVVRTEESFGGAKLSNRPRSNRPTTLYKLSGDEGSAPKEAARSWWSEKDLVVTDHRRWMAIGFVAGIMTVMTLLCLFATWQALVSPQEQCMSGTELLSYATLAMPVVTVGGIALVWVAMHWGA